jgi:hypothetical protein
MELGGLEPPTSWVRSTSSAAITTATSRRLAGISRGGELGRSCMDSRGWPAIPVESGTLGEKWPKGPRSRVTREDADARDRRQEPVRIRPQPGRLRLVRGTRVPEAIEDARLQKGIAALRRVSRIDRCSDSSERAVAAGRAPAGDCRFRRGAAVSTRASAARPCGRPGAAVETTANHREAEMKCVEHVERFGAEHAQHARRRGHGREKGSVRARPGPCPRAASVIDIPNGHLGLLATRSPQPYVEERGAVTAAMLARVGCERGT